MLKPKASTSRLPAAASNADVKMEGSEEAKAPASGVDAVAGLPSATRATTATKPNTIEQKLDRAHAVKRRKAFKEPNPLSVKKKKPNMTAAKKTKTTTTSNTAKKAKEGGKSEQEKSAAGPAPPVNDPTTGKSRKQGDGTSKKALKRKAKKAAAAQSAGQSGPETAPAAAAPKVDAAAS